MAVTAGEIQIFCVGCTPPKTSMHGLAEGVLRYFVQSLNMDESNVARGRNYEQKRKPWTFPTLLFLTVVWVSGLLVR